MKPTGVSFFCIQISRERAIDVMLRRSVASSFLVKRDLHSKRTTVVKGWVGDDHDVIIYTHHHVVSMRINWKKNRRRNFYLVVYDTVPNVDIKKQMNY